MSRPGIDARSLWVGNPEKSPLLLSLKRVLLEKVQTKWGGATFKSFLTIADSLQQTKDPFY
ncbi:MAG: hypothetical protein A2Y79_02680 [Deltaproteobacteria bacterium RBG_13_43_22]|nr:MAG: hypothetical protein A2Y79_02680 [Deltaproteobacteria bacterium RBG_13_43_22]